MKKLLHIDFAFWQRSFRFFFHVALFLMLFDWACPILQFFPLIGVYEIVFGLAAICFFICFVWEKGRFFRRFFHILASSRWLVFSLTAYLLFGFITVFYSADPIFSVSRYFIVAQMIPFSVMMLYYLFPEKAPAASGRVKAMALNCGLSGLAVALVAFIGYITNWYTVYYQRISTIRDYNQYSSILLFAAVCYTFYIVRSHLPFVKRYLALIPYWVVMTTAVYLSGSRRSLILMCVLGGVMAVYTVMVEFRSQRRNRSLKRAAVSLCLLLLCVCLSAFSASVTYRTVGTVGAARLQEGLAILETTPEEEIDEDTLESILLAGEQTELSSTLAGLIDGSGFSSREVIWDAAIDRMVNSDPIHTLFGYGASYSWDLYDELTNPMAILIREYYGVSNSQEQWMNPHNLFLNDVLEGGFLLLGLQVLLLIAIVVSLIKLLRHTPHTTVPLILLNGILYVTLMLSSAQGMIAHKFFWLLIVGQIAEAYRLDLMKNDIIS